jgi:hypothetical protein
MVQKYIILFYSKLIFLLSIAHKRHYLNNSIFHAVNTIQKNDEHSLLKFFCYRSFYSIAFFILHS